MLDITKILVGIYYEMNQQDQHEHFHLQSWTSEMPPHHTDTISLIVLVILLYEQ